ncbi:Fic family protein [Dactylosporangium sp. NPDC050588]|uniref:Fic family protein n=1 Tax=Dactylosporangium sp. NPDC050588 TaxID=3157211 RepID=UPI0033D12F0B
MRDHLLDWIRVREEVRWAEVARPFPGPVRGARDGVADHVRTTVAHRDPHRARRLLDALHRARTATELSLEVLAGWQAVVLGGTNSRTDSATDSRTDNATDSRTDSEADNATDSGTDSGTGDGTGSEADNGTGGGTDTARFRTGTAHAKRGRDRYGLHADTEPRFRACLADAADPSVPLSARAARVYLDVAFFHPFEDGNARAAMLCLYHVLHRGQVTLDLAAPLLRITRRADDPAGAADLVRLVDVLIAATHRRAAGAAPGHRT